MKKILLSVFLVLSIVIPAVAQNLDVISKNPMPETGQLVQGMAQDMRRGLMPGPMMDTPKEEMLLQGTGTVAMRPMSIMTCDDDYFDCDDYGTCTGNWPYFWGHSQNYLYTGGYGSVLGMVELKGYGTLKTWIKVIDARGIVQYSYYYANTLASSGWQQWRVYDYTYYDFAVPGIYTVQVTWKVGTVSLTQTAKVRVMY